MTKLTLQFTPEQADWLQELIDGERFMLQRFGNHPDEGPEGIDALVLAEYDRILRNIKAWRTRTGIERSQS